jgi:hypothetical protein
MSEWLDRELARELAPVAAPDALGARLGFHASRRPQWPRMMLALAAAVVVLIAGGYAAGRTNPSDLHQMATGPKASGTCNSCHTL